MINFAKMHGLGNDFMVIDNTRGNIIINKQQIQQLAHRNFGIGFDQLLMVEKSDKPNVDFYYIIYNANGEQVEQCGNGARCFARFVIDNKLTTHNPIVVETITGIITIFIDKNNIVVNMGKPLFDIKSIIKNNKIKSNIGSVNIAGFDMGLVSMGNPHAVLMVDDIDNIDIKKIGYKIQQSKDFINSVNVGFMQILNKSNIKLRVFERGVGETLACGSGACAAVAYGIKILKLDNKVKVSLLGGDIIVEQIKDDLFLSGPAQLVFTGTVDLSNFS